MAEPDAGDRDWQQQRRRIQRDALGVGVAVGGYGIAFGALAAATGFSTWQAFAFSALTFTGGTQFAVVGVIAGGGTVLAALAGGYLLGARNTLYALRLADLLAVRGVRRLVAAQFTIDESTAMALAQTSPRAARRAFWTTAASVYVLWNLATVIGAVGAGALGDPRRFGLDAAIPAAFLALLAPRLRAGMAAKRVAAAGALIALALIGLTPQGVPVLLAVLAVAAAGRQQRSVDRR